MDPLDGVLFFPVTPFAADGGVDPGALAEHVDRGVSAGAGGVFAACGTGEFHALDSGEHAVVVRTAVRATAGRAPVFAGVGGSVATAVALARSARDAGADGLLLLPPYLVEAPQEGLLGYAEAVTGATELPVIVYHRGNSVFQPETAARIALLDRVVGIKDGYGDLDLMTRMIAAVRPALAGTGKSFQFFNGLPTAELTMPAYLGAGVRLYSSAVFCFAPEISLAFHRALNAGNTEAVDLLLSSFFAPFVTLRARVPGYAVSLVKAGVRQRGLDCGGVRPPLIDPTEDHLLQLKQILADGLAAAAEVSGR